MIQRMAQVREDADLPPPRVFGPKRARIGFVGYGSVYGPILDAMERLEAGGKSSKFLELRTLWPFPAAEVRQLARMCERLYVVEHSAGAQLRGLIQREATGPMPRKLRSILRYDGKVMTPGYVISAIEEEV